MLSIFSFSHSSPANDDSSHSNDQTCTTRELRCRGQFSKPLKLCFISDHRFSTGGPLRDLFCDSSFERHEVDSIQEIAGILDKLLANDCVTIEAIAFRDHGYPGIQMVGKTEISFGGEDLDSNIFHDGKYECMVAEKSRLIFQGCYLAQGCKGQLFMSRIARSFSPHQEVTVMASPTQANAFFTGISSRVGAVGGREVRLQYRPTSEKWWYSGALSGKKRPPSFTDACVPHFEKEVSRAKKALAITGSEKCKDTEFGAKASKNLRSYQIKAEQCLSRTKKIETFEAFTLSLDSEEEPGKNCKWEDMKKPLPVTLSEAMLGCYMPYRKGDGARAHTLPLDSPSGSK